MGLQLTESPQVISWPAVKQIDLLSQANSSEESPSNEPRVLSVSDINSGIKRMLEGNYPLVWVRGEISNFKAHSSGHHYFSLKDSKSQINAVMFKGFNSRLKFRPETGMEVLIRGKVTVYEPRGNYQLFCELMEPVGAGAMQKAFEQLKAKLKKEGLFEPSRKRPLPQFPKHIAVVTSPTGAAIRDILNVLKRRNKTAKVTVVPAVVQGEASSASIKKGLELAQKIKDVDVIIVGRGGGSMEDLWGFNDEALARAIASCKVPVVSAVGHEVDFTIADFVADLRAPTPSAAAELVVKNAEDLVATLSVLEKRLAQGLSRRIESFRAQINNLEARLIDPAKRLRDLNLRLDELVSRLESSTLRRIEDIRNSVRYLVQRLGHPKDRLQQKSSALSQWELRLKGAMNDELKKRRYQLGRSSSLLDSLSPLKVVDRGYAIATLNGEVLKNSGQVSVGDEVDVQLAKGKLKTKVCEIE